MDAFKQCGQDGQIEITSGDYTIAKTAFRIGGDNFTIQGHGEAFFFGNGQKWYDQNRNNGNQAGRPISFTLWNAKNVWIDGITWRQPQFW
ncbi:hypothetical protein N0V83_010249 [Neocucurbitaria cava]|uniref:Uncharacterized protein n=1 Tax=Neocucurbitaria cava TaxID=798079 RepID=A0A9W9CHT1_9PLEO|nr:hypothetical protein N0V83_010249 [Neocucurbitaria cava]